MEDMIRDILEKKKKAIEDHKKLRESDEYQSKVKRLERLTQGAIICIKYCSNMSLRSKHISHDTLTFGLIDDTLFTLVGISTLISNGTSSPARREMRYLLESTTKHYLVDVQKTKWTKTLEQKLDILNTDIPRSSLSYIDEINIGVFDEKTNTEFRNDIHQFYSQLCKYVHRSKEQIDLYLDSFEKGSSPAFESVDDFDKVLQDFSRICDIVLVVVMSSLGIGLAGDILVDFFDDNNKWPYHKTKYMKLFSKYFDYKFERNNQCLP